MSPVGLFENLRVLIPTNFFAISVRFVVVAIFINYLIIVTH